MLELYPIYALICMFGRDFRDSNISVFCKTDNTQTVQYINRQSSSNKEVMAILRKLVWQLLDCNIHIRAEYLPGTQNTLADSMSRFKDVSDELRRLNMKSVPTAVPIHFLPQQTIRESTD